MHDLGATGWTGGRVAGQRGHREVAGHDHPDAGVDRRPERRRARAPRAPRAIAIDDGELVVGVDRPIALPGKCLAAPATPADWSPRSQADAERGDRRRVVAEGPDAERRVGRVRGDVEDRPVVDVDPDRPELEPDRPPDALGEGRVAGRTDGHRPGEGRPAVAEGEELAALLVGRDEEREPAGTAGPRRRGLLQFAVSRRTCAGDRTLWGRKSVKPATGAAASRAGASPGPCGRGRRA